MFVLENLWEINWGGKGWFTRLLSQLFCILTECPQHKHKPKWAAFINLKQQISNPNCYVTKWNHTQLSVQFQQATKKHFSKDVQCHNLKNEAPEIFRRKSESDLAFALNSQRPLHELPLFLQSLRQRKTSVFIHKQRKKVYFSARTRWGLWKTGIDLRFLPTLRISVNLISRQSGESRLWNCLPTEK